jgi:hypothetical protein
LNAELTEMDERHRRALIEETIKRLRPGAKLSWSLDSSTLVHTARIEIRGRQPYPLQITQDALDAPDDPANIERLTHEVHKQLLVSKLGGVGRITEVALR